MLRIKNESVQSLTPLPAKRRETEAFGEEKGDILNFGGEEKCTGSLFSPQTAQVAHDRRRSGTKRSGSERDVSKTVPIGAG